MLTFPPHFLINLKGQKMSIDIKIVTDGSVALEPWRQNLLDAAQLIRENGHAKGVFINDKGSLCARGAINQVRDGIARHSQGHGKEEEMLSKFLNLEERKNFCQCDICKPMRLPVAVADWNNAPERTAEEVISAMEACALS